MRPPAPRRRAPDGTGPGIPLRHRADAAAGRGRPRSSGPPTTPPGRDAGSLADARARRLRRAAPPPPPCRPAGRAIAPEEQKAHDDAKRFARLVVSEIKLYNEAKVTEGRKNRDLYERLKEDIERGRQMYHDRVAAPVRESTNYFYDELVRILAGGDASALGSM